MQVTSELFARRLDVMLEFRGMTSKDLADRLGVSTRTVSRWKTGAGGTPIQRVSDICRVFGVTEDEFWDPNWIPDPRYGGSINTARPPKAGPYLGVPTNADYMALECPRCGASDVSKEAIYCRACAFPLYNLCTAPDPDSRHRNPPDAAFCEQCARPTFWSLEYVGLDEILGQSDGHTARNEEAATSKS